jgi:hypothetical protein
MDDLLAPISSRKIQNSIDKFEKLPVKDENLTAVFSAQNGDSKHNRHKKQDSTAFLQQIYLQGDASTGTLPDDARQILKSQPNEEDFLAVLRYLQFGIDGKHDFNIRVSGPKASLIVQVLVTITIPEQWANIDFESKDRSNVETKKLLLSCLSSVAGIGALCAQIKTLGVQTLSNDTARSASLVLKDAVSILAALMQSSTFGAQLLRDIKAFYSKPAQRHIIWQEAVSYLAGGKVLSTVAQAVSRANLEDDKKFRSRNGWLVDGNEYCKWLARNICHIAVKTTTTETDIWVATSQLLKRGLSLGYPGRHCLAFSDCSRSNSYRYAGPRNLQLPPAWRKSIVVSAESSSSAPTST